MDDSQVCPLLGLSDEHGAYLTYPSYENRCYASSPHEAIALNEQTFFCLGGHRERCPRFQAWQTQHPEEVEDEQDLAAAGATALAAESSTEEPSPWARPESESSDFVWQEGEADDSDDLDLAEEGVPASDAVPPPLPPPVAATTPPPAPRRPVWPLLLAAGTLVSVLMLCGLISAFWIGWQTLSARLALNPTPSPIIEEETIQPVLVPITLTQAPAGVVVIVASPTSGQETQPTPTPTLVGAGPTLPPALPTPTPTLLGGPTLLPTPTPTWTPRATPTSRATATFFPTSTPVRTFTPTFTPVAGTTRTSTVESFSVSFTANPTTIDFGQSATLSWNVRGVRAIYLDNDPISGPTGSKRVTPSSTTTYVLRIVKVDNTVQEETQTVTVRVPTATNTPTATPTHTPTPVYRISFSENRSTALIEGTNCQTGNGCAVFQVQVSNTGNRNTRYFFIKSANQQEGWSSFFCWGSNCEFGTSPRPRTLDPGSLETASLNYLLPAIVRDGETDTITVLGYYCEEDETCPPDPLNPARRVYEQTFRITIQIPTPTPNLSQTSTHTPTLTPTATSTSTPTETTEP